MLTTLRCMQYSSLLAFYILLLLAAGHSPMAVAPSCSPRTAVYTIETAACALGIRSAQARSGVKALASTNTPIFGAVRAQRRPPVPEIRSFLGISMLAGMLIALMLSGCAKRLGGAHAPGATVELVGQLQLSWERSTTKADGTFLTDIAGYKLYYGLAGRT